MSPTVGSPGGGWITARGLSWSARGRRVLGPLDLDVVRGECLVLVGPNGAGKTTLLRLLAGVLTPSTGEVAYGGTPYGRFSRRALASRVAYVPQVRPEQVPFTVEELVLQGRFPHFGWLQSTPAATDFAAVRAALELAGIAALAQRPLAELSGGERQAAYIAAALAQEAELLLLDEPTTHLDPRHQRDVAAIVLALKRRGDRTVVLATHDLNFAAQLADRALMLKGGAVLASGRPDEIFDATPLAALFDTPFTLLPGRRHPVTLLELEP